MPEDVDWTTRALDYEPPEVDTSQAHAARMYDYFLGGKDNYPADREAAEQLVKVIPSVPVTIRQNRLFLHRVVRGPGPPVAAGREHRRGPGFHDRPLLRRRPQTLTHG